MPPKKKQATRGRLPGLGKGKKAKSTASPSSPSPSDSSSRHSSLAGGGGADAPASTNDCARSPTPLHGSRDGSPHGSHDGSRDSFPDVSPHGSHDGSPVSTIISSASAEVQGKKKTKKTGTKKKRAKKSDYSLSPANEALMLEFIVENPLLWNKRLNDYKNPSKKAKVWEEPVTRMRKDVNHLLGWFTPLRDSHTPMHKKKSGDGAREWTERDQWIKDNFGFLLTMVSHRPESSSLPKDKGRGKRTKTDDDDALLSALQMSINESGAALQDLQVRQQPPVTERSTFVNYVRDSLLDMSKRKYKTVRVAVNRILSDAMEDDLLQEEATGVAPIAHPVRMTGQMRPTSAPFSLPAAPMSSSPGGDTRHQQGLCGLRKHQTMWTSICSSH